jgi:flagellar biosynthetic protein FliR
MGTLTIDLVQVQTFLFVVLRVGALVAAMPNFDRQSLPPTFTAGLILAFSFLLISLVPLPAVGLIDGIIPLGLNAASEILLGVSIGLVVRMVFAGIMLAGQLAGYQMGLAIANVMDPASSQQVPILGQVYNLMALLIFFTINAHHWFLKAIVNSFERVPPFGFAPSQAVVDRLIDLSVGIFVVGIQAAAPVVVTMLITSVALGLVARTSPQMNVFIVALPLQMVVGLIILAGSLPYFLTFMNQVFAEMIANILAILKLVT